MDEDDELDEVDDDTKRSLLFIAMFLFDRLAVSRTIRIS